MATIELSQRVYKHNYKQKIITKSALNLGLGSLFFHSRRIQRGGCKTIPDGFHIIYKKTIVKHCKDMGLSPSKMEPKSYWED